MRSGTRLWRCAVLKDREGRGLSRFSGGLGEGETPLPIPNRAVKPLSADGTWLARAWESRSPPVLDCDPIVSTHVDTMGSFASEGACAATRVAVGWLAGVGLQGRCACPVGESPRGAPGR